uniref:Adenylyltransferase and sulfurtransferase n=1 Tax=Candidatus Kentrum sp. TC TaxID=2126339 RepID=A0A450YWR3_9GAMM|nr:MAG: adenylyltransferase and sulfurtransferase [Candidatus Kentron sp. TC]
MSKQFRIETVKFAEESLTDRQERISWWEQSVINNARVLVVGAGAIGNEVLKNLMLLGFGKVAIVDFDTISASNLSRTVLFRMADVGKRKAEVARECALELAVNDNASILAIHADAVWSLGRQFYRQFDIVLGCLDNIECRRAVGNYCRLADRPFIDAGIMELRTRLNVYPGGNAACFECGLSASDRERSQEHYSCDKYKNLAFTAGKVATTQVASAFVAAQQVQEAVKLLMGITPDHAQKHFFDGMSNRMETFGLPRNNECYVCSYEPSEVMSVELTVEASVSELLVALSNDEGIHDPVIRIGGDGVPVDFRFIDSLIFHTEKKGVGNYPVRSPNFAISIQEVKQFKKDHGLSDIPFEERVLTDVSSTTDPEILAMSLSDIGFPDGGTFHVYPKGEIDSLVRFGLNPVSQV